MPTECERGNVTLFGQQQQQSQQQTLQQSEIHNNNQKQQQPQQAQQINQQRLKQQKEEEDDNKEVAEAQDENYQEKQYYEKILVESEYYTMEERKDLAATNGEMSTSQTSTTSTTSSNGHNGLSNGGGRKSSIISPDPTAYVTKARVTKPTPPPPSYNPMQFVQIKPSHLYQTAQQQLKKAEEVKKIKEVKKEEPEDWQNNLDNWKSSRRKRVEHIIDRVVEVKKLELEEHDRSRRKSKTFSEMIEERGERGARGRTKLVSLAVYNEDESNDLSDLGIGTSSASGKSSISEDYDNNSFMSDNAAELDKAIFESNNLQEKENHQKINYQEKSTTENINNNNNNNKNGTTREYVSSPGYDTSSSTAPASSPDPCEYTYEGAIQDYKQRVSRAVSGNANVYKLPNSNNTKHNFISSSKESIHERTNDSQASIAYPIRRGSKIEDRLIGFEVTSPSDNQESVEKLKLDVPKIDILKRKEIFEQTTEPKLTTAFTNGVTAPKVTLRDRFNVTATTTTTATNIAENTNIIKRDIKRMSGDMTSIRDRLQSLEQQQQHQNGISAVSRIDDIPVPPLKERLSCLQNAVTKEEIKKKPVSLVDDRQLEIMKDEDENAKLRLRQQYAEQASNDMIADIETELGKTMQQLDTSTESQPVAEEEQLNAAIAALAIEEQQLEAAANAVNQIEAEFAELSDGALLAPTNNTATANDMEFSVSVTNKNFPQDVLCESSSFNSSSGSNNNNNNGNNVNGISGELVKENETQTNNLGVLGNADVSGSPNIVKLQRKPSNEMVHHRNLLKMFKDTFKNDIDLDEMEEEQIKTPQETILTTLKSTEDANNNLELKEIIKTTTDPFSVESTNSTPCKGSITSVPQSPTAAHRNTNSMIPRSLNSPVGKPPMSPMSTRNYNKIITPESPLCSPTAMRKTESQFSINGRVEIFNSKNVNNNNNNNNNNIAKTPTTPTLPRKSYLPHLISTANSNSGSGGTSAVESNSHIELPTSTVATTFTTVTQPSLSPMVSNNYHSKPNNFDSDVNIISGRSMPTIEKTVNEPQVIRYSTSKPLLRTTTATATSPYVQQEALKDRHQQQQQHQHQQPERQSTENEVIICAPPVTILNPDELPKPNTVRAMASCFSHNNNYDESFTGKQTPPKLPPKPIPRNQATKLPRQVHKTPPQSPLTVRRDISTDIISHTNSKEGSDKPTVNARNSGMSTGYPFINKPKSSVAPKINPLKPNESLTPLVLEAAVEPLLVSCSPNSSSLFKLAGSTPPSPISPRSVTAQSSMEPSATDIALCADFLDALGASADIKTFESPPKLEHQTTIEEVLCEKLDVKKLPPGESLPCTGYADISAEDIDRCDGVQFSVNKSHAKVDAKAQSPIGAARAAHSKALIETCERIIAEERLASSRLKSAMTPIKKPVGTASPKNTPTMQRKSKIPLPRSLPCLKGSGSMNNADLELISSTQLADHATQDEGPLIARLHVVETQIKVTSTPPASPKVVPKSQLPSPVAHPKKTRNIFEFLKKNFGHHEEASSSVKTQEIQQSTPSTKIKVDKVDKEKDKDKVIVVKKDEVHTVDNSTFYLPINDDSKNNADDEVAPPPLPLTPAPVNIEITKTITTDEILESANTELALSREINNMLDDELEKFKSEKAHACVKDTN